MASTQPIRGASIAARLAGGCISATTLNISDNNGQPATGLVEWRVGGSTVRLRAARSDVSSPGRGASARSALDRAAGCG
eukprot:6173494-Pleurochrysis_carterae.AAC.3